MNLLPRFYDVDGGEILIDGVEIRNYTLGSLRSKIGIVMQKTFLFNLSIPIDRLRRNRKVFMIAHRLWTLKSTDRILVLDGGRIVQNGTHEEFMSSQGPYSDIYSLHANSESYGVSVSKEGK